MRGFDFISIQRVFKQRQKLLGGTLAFGLALMPVFTPVTLAEPMAVSTPVDQMRVVGAKSNDEEVKNILKLVNDLIAASNRHDLDGVINHYAPRFVSGDNLSLEDIKNLILETWKTFPDIKYNTQTLEVRINGAWATVESIDTSTASAKVDPIVSQHPGTLESRSRGMLYLHRVGKNWEILSDLTLHERAEIKYGDVTEAAIDLTAPEQVFSGESYSAKVDLDVPKGVLAIASISREPLVYPQEKPVDKFRSLTSNKDSLERIFNANTYNNNEIVTATIGFTRIEHEDDHPTIKLDGITTIVKRVNVIPTSDYGSDTATHEVINFSPGGKIDLRNQDKK